MPCGLFSSRSTRAEWRSYAQSNRPKLRIIRTADLFGLKVPRVYPLQPTRLAACRLRVKRRRTQCEQMFSALARKRTSADCFVMSPKCQKQTTSAHQERLAATGSGGELGLDSRKPQRTGLRPCQHQQR